MLAEVNRSRFDKALQQLFPVQRTIMEKSGGQRAPFDAGLRSRMSEMGNLTAVTSTIALLRSQVEKEQWLDAGTQALLLGLGLSRLWSEVPAYKKLDFAKEDLAAAPDHLKEMELRKLGFAACDAREFTIARDVASQLLQRSSAKDYRGMDPGHLRHVALTLRGLIELESGETAAAEKTLLESMTPRMESAMRTMGPNFRLAQALLNKGRQQPVDQFLALVAESIWRDSSRAADWRKEIAAGRPVSLGNAFAY